VQALGELGAPDSAALIRRALDDPDQAVRRAAFETLEDLDDDANFQAAFPGD
jgi:HEAT repeat protein